MKRILTIILAFLSISVSGQNNPTQVAQPIVAEGKLLYKSEMASWYGTDLFLKNYKEMVNIGGYFSYSDGGSSKCIFFSQANSPKVIGTISFDTTFNTRTAEIDLSERNFTNKEKDLYQIRKVALAEINSDTLFKVYNNTNLNLIPLIHEKERKVYVLTATNKSGVVIFGNDYLLSFNKNNKLTHKKQLHKNIIPHVYGNTDVKNKEIEGAVHNHSPATGNFITATDICTLMLYEKLAGWKTYSVISEKYLNIWDFEKDQLTVVPVETTKDSQIKNKRK